MCADINEDDEQKGYTWEIAYAEGLNIREVLEEDESGSVEKSVAKLIFEAKRKRRLTDRPARIRLGIMRYVYIIIDCSLAMTEKTLLPTRLNVTLKMRYVYIIIDCSLAMTEKTLLPTRLNVTLKVLNQFLEKFSEQNPISQVGIIICRDKRAERLIQLTGKFTCIVYFIGCI
uniref:Ssl1 domain-containing protein n=2 Tax=Ascaris lumbricoides TaxID=6252 RepID=A0A0M3IQW6_ASCLU